MPNTSTINQTAINQTTNIPVANTSSGFGFNGFDMCSENFTIREATVRDRDYNLTVSQNPYVDGGVVLSHLMNRKSIQIDFTIKADTQALLQEQIDLFKKATAETNWEFYFNFFGETRVINCSIESDTYEAMPYGSTIQNWSISFRAVDAPRFRALLPISKTYQNITSTLNGDITNTGSAKTYPVYYIIFGIVTWVDAIDITLGGYITTINQIIASNDVLIINGDITDENGWNVTLNWVEIDYSWPIDTQLDTGSNPFSISINGTFTCNISVIYTKYFE